MKMTKNKNIPEGYMTVGQVAKKMGITVRTLQYYDKERAHRIGKLSQRKAKAGADFIQIRTS